MSVASLIAGLTGRGSRVPSPERGWAAQGRPGAAGPVDQALIWLTVGLLALGMVMVYSASVALPDNPKFERYAHTHFLVRHLVFIAISFVFALLAFQVPIATWERVAPWLFIASLCLLVLVLIPHIGKGVNGARRWIGFGVMSFQPSELAKFAVLLYAADYMVRKMEVKERFFRAVLPMAAAVAIVGVLLLAEPDMGAFIGSCGGRRQSATRTSGLLRGQARLRIGVGCSGSSHSQRNTGSFSTDIWQA